MISIEIVSEEKNWSKKIKKIDPFFRSICKSFPKKYQYFNKKIYLTLLLSNNKRIKRLNKKFRNKNKPTDVLSFPNFEKKNLRLVKQKNFYIGDIAISYEIIKSRALKNNFQSEFDKAWVHGLLHLIGFDHIKNKDYFKMKKIEKRILNLI